MTWAVVISAIIFGMMHMNIVQFVYAGFLGVFLALCVERTKHLYGAILAHMAANTISVIRTETNWLSWMDESLQAADTYHCRNGTGIYRIVSAGVLERKRGRKENNMKIYEVEERTPLVALF